MIRCSTLHLTAPLSTASANSWCTTVLSAKGLQQVEVAAQLTSRGDVSLPLSTARRYQQTTSRSLTDKHACACVALQWHAGDNVGTGGDYTLFSTVDGIVIYSKKKDKSYVSTVASPHMGYPSAFLASYDDLRAARTNCRAVENIYRPTAWLRNGALLGSDLRSLLLRCLALLETGQQKEINVH